MKKLNLAIIGQGRSGKNIHGLYYRSESNIYYDVKYVVEADEYRRELAKELYPGCTVFADYCELFDKSDIDIVVNASYSDMHYPISKDLLLHDFNVLTEKPMARNRYECEDLIKTAAEHNVIIAPFMQTFYAPYYLKARELVESGILGEIKQINIVYSNFARRWDWQTMQKKLAGNIYNTGPHPIGLALAFLDFDKNTKVVYSRLGKTLTSGDADDYAKILLEAPDKPLIDLEINSNDAYPVWNLKILGSRGTLMSNLSQYKLTYIIDGENPEKPVQENFIHNEKGEPIYCSETLIKHEDSGNFDSNAVFNESVAMIYKDLYFAITEGEPLKITPQMAEETIAVIEKVHSENPLPLIN